MFHYNLIIIFSSVTGQICKVTQISQILRNNQLIKLDDLQQLIYVDVLMANMRDKIIISVSFICTKFTFKFLQTRKPTKTSQLRFSRKHHFMQQADNMKPDHKLQYARNKPPHEFSEMAPGTLAKLPLQSITQNSVRSPAATILL